MRVKIAQIKDLAEYMKPDTRRLDESSPQIDRMEWDGDALTVMMADGRLFCHPASEVKVMEVSVQAPTPSLPEPSPQEKRGHGRPPKQRT